MYQRSLLALRVLSDDRTGAVAAGARDGWAYVWPRDAAVTGLALEAAGYRSEARRIARFLPGLDLHGAARFYGNGQPVTGRGAQGDAEGWVSAAVRDIGLRTRAEDDRRPQPKLRIESDMGTIHRWQGQVDYQEKSAGDYLANAIAASAKGEEIAALFGTARGLVREARDPDSGLDSAAAWAVRPFALRPLYPLARRTLLRLAAASGRFGIVPSADWAGGRDPWTAPTAWATWSLAALGERRGALRLLAELRHAATPAGMLPERVDFHSGVPRSTTPLAWSHAFAVLALRELWPRRDLATQSDRRQRPSQ